MKTIQIAENYIFENDIQLSEEINNGHYCIQNLIKNGERYFIRRHSHLKGNVWCIVNDNGTVVDNGLSHGEALYNAADKLIHYKR